MTTHAPTINFTPYPEQREVLASDKRFKVVAAGRRSGKTLLAGAETVRRAFEGGDGWLGWWMAPGNDIAETGFRLIDRALPDEVVERRKASPPYRHEFTNGARLDYRTADGDANVSVGLDWVVIDEAAKGIPERIWTQDIRPTLSDKDGAAMFISTPDGKGWFHDWWHRGQSDDEYPSIGSWRWSTYANPHVPDSEIDDAKAELPQRIFEQEYLAHFRDDTGGVFDAERASEAYVLPEDETPCGGTDGPYRLAADLARHEDYLAIVGLDANGKVSHLTRERGLSWSQVQRRIEDAASAHGDPPVAVDATRDNKLVADLERSGLDIRPVKFTSQSKQTMVENLAAGIESDEVTIPADTILQSELAVFEYTTTSAGNVRYDAPSGHHDDTVDAIAMAYSLPVGGNTSTATVTFGESQSSSATGNKDFESSPFGQAVKEFQKRR